MSNAKWVVEIKVRNHATGQDEWRKMRPSHAETPYRYETEAEAWDMRRRLYPEQTEDEVRVRQEAPSEHA